MITVEVNNIQYTNFIEISVSAGIDEIARSFSFQVASTIFDQFPIKTGNQIKIYADGTQILKGFVEIVERNVDINNDIITISGRSNTADLVMSTIDNRVEFIGQISLRTIAENMISYLISEPLPQDDLAADPPPGFIVTSDPLRIPVVIEEVIEDFSPSENFSEAVGETYFAVFEKLAAKRQLLATTNGKGELVFTRGHGSQSSSLILRNLRNDDGSNNLKSSKVIYDNTERYNTYEGNSQVSKGGLRKITEITPNGLLIGDGRVIDPGIRASKKFYFVPENLSDNVECQNRVAWEATVRKSRSVKHIASVYGHSYKKQTWEINLSVNIIDEYANIDAKMLISNVAWRQSVSGGSTTEITSIPPNAYTFPEKTFTGKLGDNFEDIPLGVY